MGLYNELYTCVRCPRCGKEAEMVVDLYFGQRDLLKYKIGETYKWIEGKSPKMEGVLQTER